MKILLAATIALVFWTGPAIAQNDAVPASKVTKVCDLLELLGTEKLARQMTDQTIETFRKEFPDVPAEFWNEFRASVEPSELQALIVPIYAEHFDEDELEGILDFYRSPLGEKLVRELPLIAQESMERGVSWSRVLVNRLLERLKTRGYTAGP